MLTRPGGALAATWLVQALATLAMSTASVLAPAVAPQLGLAPERVGLYTAVAYLAAMLSGLRAGHGVAHAGATRVSQFALLSCAAGAAAALAGHGAALLAAAVLIGVGYGLVNPAAAVLLSFHAPLQQRGTFFSLKQSGVPVGVALAGIGLPAALLAFGWRGAVLAVLACCAALGVALWPMRPRLDPPAATARVDAPARPATGSALAQVWRSPGLRRLSLASLAFAGTQQGFLTFVVALLHLRLGWSLTAAAGVLALSQAVATGARIGFGIAGDRWIGPGRLLGALGLAMALACLGLAALRPETPTALVALAAWLCAATAMGWNGVYFAELGRRVPRDELARVSGATQFFTFFGGMLFPLLFGEIVRHGGSYALAYGVLAIAPAAAGLAMLRGARSL